MEAQLGAGGPIMMQTVTNAAGQPVQVSVLLNRTSASVIVLVVYQGFFYVLCVLMLFFL